MGIPEVMQVSICKYLLVELVYIEECIRDSFLWGLSLKTLLSRVCLIFILLDV